jgi:RNA-directed DNA polymerase
MVRFKATEAPGWARATLTRLGLTLNEVKTSVRNARRERFDFPGYTLGPHFSRRTGREYIGFSPSKKSVNRIKEKVGEHLKPGNVEAWEEVRGPAESEAARLETVLRSGESDEGV